MTVDIKQHKPDEISAALLAHYDLHKRDLPWRMSDHSQKPDPYHVWLSEIMLQQTTVAAVKPYYAKFLKLWPTVQELARAAEADVMAHWAGLGYYARARNLRRCAQMVDQQYGGEFPETETELLKLPGVGAYTAAAIAAIAFGEAAVVVDANVERVVARLFAIDTPLPAGKKAIYAATASITPQDRAGDFAQAMMDLGAGICSVKAPKCDVCPLSHFCKGFGSGNAETLPIKAAKKPKPHRLGTIFWIEQNKNVWVVTRPSSGMLGGMRALPDDEWVVKRNGNGEPPISGTWQMLDSKVHHVFTHFSLELSLALYCGPKIDMNMHEGEFWPLQNIDDAGFPTVFKKAATEFLKAT